MAAAQRGDVDAYGALLNDVGPMVLRFVRSRVIDGQEVDDVYQETFLALHRVRHTYEPLRPVEPWLLAIAGHVLARHGRRRRTRMAREVLADVPPPLAVEAAGPLRSQLDHALRRLSPTQREAIQLVQLDGLSIQAAAARAGTTTGAFKVRAHRAYKAFRELLGT